MRDIFDIELTSTWVHGHFQNSTHTMVGHVFDRSRLKVIDVPSTDEQSVQADHCLGKKQQLINRTASIYVYLFVYFTSIVKIW